MNKIIRINEGPYARVKVRNYVHMVVLDKFGRVKSVSHSTNLRTTAGLNWQSDLMGSAAGVPAKYIGLTENATAPAIGDTTLAGELTTDGLTRALALYNHTPGSPIYTLFKAFTVTGGPHTIEKTAVFTLVSGGVMVFEAVANPVSVVDNTDTLNVTWTISLP